MVDFTLGILLLKGPGYLISMALRRSRNVFGAGVGATTDIGATDAGAADNDDVGMAAGAGFTVWCVG